MTHRIEARHPARRAVLLLAAALWLPAAARSLPPVDALSAVPIAAPAAQRASLAALKSATVSGPVVSRMKDRVAVVVMLPALSTGVTVIV